MKVTITGRKVSIKDSFKERVDKKLKKLSRFFGDDAQANITVTIESGRQTVEMTVKYAGMLFRAEETAPEMEEALDRVHDALVRQIRKNKTRLEKRMRENAYDVFQSDELADEHADSYQIVRSKSFSLKPMSVEEAILQMNLLGHVFFVYLDMDTERVSVVYRRNNGDYGLIETI